MNCVAASHYPSSSGKMLKGSIAERFSLHFPSSNQAIQSTCKRRLGFNRGELSISSCSLLGVAVLELGNWHVRMCERKSCKLFAAQFWTPETWPKPSAKARDIFAFLSLFFLDIVISLWSCLGWIIIIKSSFTNVQLRHTHFYRLASEMSFALCLFVE